MTFWIAAAALLVAIVTAATVGLGMRRLERIENLPPVVPPAAPLVTIVVPARNEARGIEAGLSSLLAQTYAPLEIVVIDDRSTDGTGAVIDRLAAGDRRIVPIHVTELPPGWLGKNHALWLGSRAAGGEWLLFADADVVMEPETIARVMGYALEHGIDHVPMTPRLGLPGVMLEAFVVVFTFFFCAYFQPWKAPDPKSRHFVGVGAFNLVRRSAYLRAGTHQRIPLRPDDDVKLGKILKQTGSRQEMLVGASMMRVEWYHSIRELIAGLEKNAFAGVDYRAAITIASVILQLVLVVGPLAGVVLAGGPARWLFAAAIGLSLAGFAGAADRVAIRRSRALLYPVVVLLFDYILLRTMVKNLADGGLRWRDTFYPLKQLKANRV